jgi:hypothetical protein
MPETVRCGQGLRLSGPGLICVNPRINGRGTIKMTPAEAMMDKTRTLKPKPAGCGTRRRVEVGAEERVRLIEACAFFRADQHRPVAVDGFREQDRREAALEIDTVIRKRRKR